MSAAHYSDFEKFQLASRRALRAGWAVASLKSIEGDIDRFQAVCQKFGRVRPARPGRHPVEILSPKSCREARPQSLSALHGLGEFPAHTDCAHWPTPPRLLVMYCKGNDACRSTLLYDWQNIVAHLTEPSTIFREVFLIKSGRHSFYDSIAARHRKFVRFDRGCMYPTTPRSARVLGEVRRALSLAEPQEIAWSPGATLFVDNWRVLHARGIADQSAERLLYRALFVDLFLLGESSGDSIPL